MRAADAEGHPIELFVGAVTYFPWLIREIAKSAWAVTKIILHPRLPISPTMTVVTCEPENYSRRGDLCEFDHSHARHDHRRA